MTSDVVLADEMTTRNEAKRSYPESLCTEYIFLMLTFICTVQINHRVALHYTNDCLKDHFDIWGITKIQVFANNHIRELIPFLYLLIQ